MKSPSRSIYVDRYLKEVRLSEGRANLKLSRVIQIFVQLVIDLANNGQIQFSTLFSRLSFIISSFPFTSFESRALHYFRVAAQDVDKRDEYSLSLGKYCINLLLTKVREEDPVFPQVDLDIVKNSIGQNLAAPVAGFYRECRVFLMEVEKNKKKILAQLENEPFDEVILSYGRSDRNEDYSELIEKADQFGMMPLKCCLIDIEIDEEGIFYPSSFVFEPDMLIDVTAISECFGAFRTHPVGYFLRRLKDSGTSVPLLIGNLSNFFLDQLVYRPHLGFDELKKQIFQLYPIALSLLNDAQVKEMLSVLAVHFDNIKIVVQNELPNLGLTSQSTYIEPSFFSARYGIQGRLDLFGLTSDSATIVELKSGMPFRPNAYGMSNNHFHQTLLYDMLIESVFGPQLKRRNFLLYSKVPNQQLRFAPALRSEQRETIKVRNELLLLDRELMTCSDILDFVHSIRKRYGSILKGYLKKDMEAVSNVFESLDMMERKYCTAAIRFSIVEQYLSKLGDETNERKLGLASLWKLDLATKKDQFSILNHLEIITNHSDKDEPYLVLEMSEWTVALSNFRIGDIIVFYPYLHKKDSILHHQIFKCTILDISDKHVKIRLRSRQENPSVFKQHRFWNIERDVLERGFYTMTRNVLHFARSDKLIRDLLLCRQPPKIPESTSVDRPALLTDEQFEVFKRMISAKDYFLLWGPPGTGKTSILFKEIVRYIYDNGNERLLLMAYTNRAVDEMCKAIVSIDKDIQFIRVGSKFSTSSEYQDKLLQDRVKKTRDRATTIRFLKSQRIYVGTVASLTGKRDLFDLVNFDFAIVDEASQILEPSLVGLLTRVKRFVLIGDHLQLPAIVLQDTPAAETENLDLTELGITSLSNSLFERMYRTAVRKSWIHAYGQLTFQGRMHSELLDFPNQHFYNGTLSPLPTIDRLFADRNLKTKDDYQKKLANQRLIFMPTSRDLSSDSIKINEEEAENVAQVISDLVDIYKMNEMDFRPDSIGVITPYRAQIARITRLLSQRDLLPQNLITIDTVERYQGSARDIIIFSTCINYEFQMSSLISLSDLGVDRKLNVAYTRAREQFILIGNREILALQPLYKSLIERSVHLGSKSKRVSSIGK